MRAVLSSEALTMRDPSGEKATDHTNWSCRAKTAISLGGDASQMRRCCPPTP